MTVQAPQVARSQTFLEPVIDSRSRKASSSVTRGSSSSLWTFPFTRRVTGTAPGPTNPASEPGGAALATVPPTSRPPDTVTPAPFRKSRRVNADFSGPAFPGRSFFRLIGGSLLGFNFRQLLCSGFQKPLNRQDT